MNPNLTEQRRHIRVYFNNAEETSCQLSSGEESVVSWSASVLDLSMGGLRVSMRGGAAFAIGDRLVITGLTHKTGFCCEQQIPLVVRWVAACTRIGGFHMGCQFLALSEKSQCGIDNLIRMKIAEFQNAGSLPLMSA